MDALLVDVSIPSESAESAESAESSLNAEAAEKKAKEENDRKKRTETERGTTQADADRWRTPDRTTTTTDGTNGGSYYVTPLQQQQQQQRQQQQQFDGDISPTTADSRGQERFYAQYFQRYELLIEYKSLANEGHCPRGVYVVPILDDLYTWQGVLFVHGSGYYRSGVLRFTLSIPEEYPQQAPAVFFTTPDVFHPLVEPATGRFQLGQQFPQWRPRRDHLCHVLFYLQSAFEEQVLENLNRGICLNLEAFDEFQNNRELFAQRIATWVKSTLDSEEFRKDEPTDTLRFPYLASNKEEETMNRIYKNARLLRTPRAKGAAAGAAGAAAVDGGSYSRAGAGVVDAIKSWFSY